MIRKLRAANRDRQRHREDLVFQAWHVEAFHRSKRLPDLGRILRRMRTGTGAPQQMSGDQVAAVIRAWKSRLKSSPKPPS